MATATLLLSLVAALSIAYFLRKVLGLRTADRPPLPPGPKGLPLLGNISDLPPPDEFEAKHWLRHKELYGMSSSQVTAESNDASLFSLRSQKIERGMRLRRCTPGAEQGHTTVSRSSYDH